MSPVSPNIKDNGAPPLRLFLREIARLPLIAAAPLRRARARPHKGADGAPVIVIPGLLSADATTSFLRRSLDAAGYTSYPSMLGFVTGISSDDLAQLEQRLFNVSGETGRKVSLIGWSLGGFYARVLAQRHPELVELVMTLGTPFSGSRRANNAWRLYNLINDHSVDEPRVADDPAEKPAVPTIAIWSPNDGVVSPAGSRGQGHERDEAVEVTSGHFAMATGRGGIAEVLAVLEQIRAKAVKSAP